MFEKTKDAFNRFVAGIRDVRSRLKEVNKFLITIDRTQVIWQWIGALWSSVRVLVQYFFVGLSFGVMAKQFIKDGSLSANLIALFVFAIIFYRLVSNGVSVWGSFKQEVFSENLEFKLEQTLVDHIRSLDIARLSDPEFLQLKDNAEHRGKQAVERLFQNQLSFIQSLATLIVTFAMVAVLQPLLLLLLILPVLPRIIREIKIEKKARVLWQQQHLSRRKKDVLLVLLTDGPSLVTITLLQFGNFIWQRFVKIATRVLEENIALSRYSRNSNLVMMGPEVFVGGIMAFLLLGQIHQGGLSATSLFLVIGSVTQFPNALFGLSKNAVKMRTQCLDYDYFRNFLATQPLLDEKDAKDIQLTTCPLVRLTNVTFRYPRQDRFALQNCSLEIRPGEKIAIVGENGSGKTTFARLVSKVFMSEVGDVRINATPVRFFTQRSWMKHIMYVEQTFRVLRLKVHYAIAGAEWEFVDQSKLQRVAEVLGTNQFIECLPDKYSSQIGEEWPGGVGFSGGQYQRLGLAAALYRFLDPEVYVGLFDEPMASCDAETKNRFYRAITKETPGKIVVVIAHDPLYLHYFDRIIVMKEGCVVSDLRGGEVQRFRAEAIQGELR